ncbi:NADPH-dependent F420 reductase [Blastococcus sp. SYSU D00820]
MTDGRVVEELLVGVLGGPGTQGPGLAVRLAAAGQRVLLGAADAGQAEATAAGLARAAAAAAGGEVWLRGGADVDVAGAADLVVVAVPFAGHARLLSALAAPLAGKVVVDSVVPVDADEFGPYVLAVPEGSATQQAAALLPDSRVTGAFHHLPAALLEDLSRPTLDADVLVVGDDREATDLVQALAGRLPGMRGVYAGRLRDARPVEALAVNLGAVQARYGGHAGLRVTGV